MRTVHVYNSKLFVFSKLYLDLTNSLFNKILNIRCNCLLIKQNNKQP